ncbi:hypothetical protein [Streptomyces sp. SID3343]|uniref:hypothetical protein n=1 Tax=Streptomyces sp. SID3343 TaxID=2690260 RepID=UPI00136973AF|nr:hypothetical protein [Streptomyces sp. SID3343]MYW04860.1 hypothetical protein [Streptomyces sp. SID3343]
MTEPTPAFVADLLRRSPRWWGPIRLPDSDGVVEIALAAQEWTLGRVLPEQCDLVITYDPATGAWHIPRL